MFRVLQGQYLPQFLACHFPFHRPQKPILEGHWGDDLGGNSLGDSIILHFLCFGPNLRVRTKDDGDEGFGIELRFRAIQPFRVLPDTADACPRFLDEVDTVEQVGNERIAPYARASQFGLGQSLRNQASLHVHRCGRKVRTPLGAERSRDPLHGDAPVLGYHFRFILHHLDQNRIEWLRH